MNHMLFYCVANVVKRDLLSPGSLLYNSNYAMDVNVFPCVLGAQCHMCQ